MDIKITLQLWMLPTLITFIAIAWALTKEKPRGMIGDGLETIFYLVPALGISCLSWVLYVIVQALIG